MDAAGKRSAFRDKIRKDYIEKLFREERIRQHKLQAVPEESNWSEQFTEAVQHLPKSVETLVRLVMDHEESIIPLLFDSVPQLMGTFSETNSIEWSNYLYLFEKMLVDETLDRDKHFELINKCAGPVISKSFSLWTTNKFMIQETMRNYFQFLVTLGSGISLLKNVDIILVNDAIDFAFTNLSPQGLQEIFDPLLVTCNNVMYIQGDSPDQIQRNYQFKKLFIKGLLKNPLILQSIIRFGIAAELKIQVEGVLRFLINLTFSIQNPEQVKPFLQGLLTMILCHLCQKSLSNTGVVLLLRLINNIIVQNIYFCESLLKENIIGMMLEQFGRQEQPCIRIQLVGTVSALVMAAREDKDMLLQLLKMNIHIFLLDSLESIRRESQLCEKCLESIKLLNICQQGLSQLPNYIRYLQDLVDKSQNQKIVTLCDQLLNTLSSNYSHI